ncbi:MAG: hypothetical protein GX363_00760, partial [Clostridiales bacterium]|nr:hypothetical protein [Clostridiales bacterium]
SISIIGHITKNKFLDELGDSIVDSTILTGQIAGQVASGTTDIVVGKLKHKPKYIQDGKNDLKDAGYQIVNNYVTNIKLIYDNSGEIVKGIHQKDGKRIWNGAKTLGKIVAIGTITVGAIKVNPSDDGYDNKKQD